MNEFEEFVKNIKNKSPKVHRATNPYGIKQFYRWLVKNKWFDIGKELTEREVGQLIREVNIRVGQYILDGNVFELPSNMGSIEVRTYKSRIKFKNGRIDTALPINWDSTYKLWFEDKQARERKTLVRYDNLNRCTIYHKRVNFPNSSYFKFHANYLLKKELTRRINNGQHYVFLLNKQ